MMRIERARAILAQVLAADATHGTWTRLDVGGSEVRVRTIDAELGWKAMVTSPFSSLPTAVDAVSYDAAVLLRHARRDRLPNCMDLSIAAGAKVLSVGWSANETSLVSITSGSWKVAFGLARRDWHASARPSVKTACEQRAPSPVAGPD